MNLHNLERNEFNKYCECPCGHTETFLPHDVEVCPKCGEPGPDFWKDNLRSWKEVIKKPTNFRYIRNPDVDWWQPSTWFMLTCDWVYRETNE